MPHAEGCTNWPIANPDDTVTCWCGSRSWKPEMLLKTIVRRTGAMTRRRRVSAVLGRLRRFVAGV